MKTVSTETIQEKLIQKGYRTIELCDIIDGEHRDEYYYALSKGDEIAKPDSCVLFTSYDLKSPEANEIFNKWMNQIHIYPDPRTLL